MGTLAGLSRRLLPIGGSVQIASPSERCLSALESLGLDALLSIEPPTAPWRGKVEQIRAALGTENAPSVHLDAKEQTLHVLNSHLTLSEMSEENEEKFRNVTDCLKEELERQKRMEELLFTSLENGNHMNNKRNLCGQVKI